MRLKLLYQVIKVFEIVVDEERVSLLIDADWLYVRYKLTLKENSLMNFYESFHPDMGVKPQFRSQGFGFCYFLEPAS